jgi:hypothetical protein
MAFGIGAEGISFDATACHGERHFFDPTGDGSDR